MAVLLGTAATSVSMIGFGNGSRSSIFPFPSPDAFGSSLARYLGVASEYPY
jgi:hypothetical protein